MFTINYKGHYINGYCDKPECCVVFMRGLDPSGVRLKTKSLLAAKRAITSYIKELN